MDLSDRVQRLSEAIRDVPDFPKPGIMFKDIAPLLADPAHLNDALDLMVFLCGDRPVDKVAAIESRGFILGAFIAARLRAGFVPVRKPGKLPAETVSVSYDLEYGKDSLEVHADAIEKGERVLIVDDVIATGGTAAAAVRLLKGVDADIAAFAVFIELVFLNGARQLDGIPLHALVRYD